MRDEDLRYTTIEHLLTRHLRDVPPGITHRLYSLESRHPPALFRHSQPLEHLRTLNFVLAISACGWLGMFS